MLVDKWWDLLANTGRRDREWTRNDRAHKIERADGKALLEWFGEEQPQRAPRAAPSRSACSTNQQRISRGHVVQDPTRGFSVRKGRILALGTADVAGDQTWFFTRFALGQDEAPNSTTSPGALMVAVAREPKLDGLRGAVKPAFRGIRLHRGRVPQASGTSRSSVDRFKGQVFAGTGTQPCGRRVETVRGSPTRQGRSIDEQIMGLDVAKSHDYTVAVLRPTTTTTPRCSWSSSGCGPPREHRPLSYTRIGAATTVAHKFVQADVQGASRVVQREEHHRGRRGPHALVRRVRPPRSASASLNMLQVPLHQHSRYARAASSHSAPRTLRETQDRGSSRWFALPQGRSPNLHNNCWRVPADPGRTSGRTSFSLKPPHGSLTDDCVDASSPSRQHADLKRTGDWSGRPRTMPHGR